MIRDQLRHVSMAKPIQAGSLAPVIDLADNPPDQPLHGSVGDLQQPLVLYIARVPGSHDVFLTTMKPQQKIVTAQDVQSSLYYMHLDRPEDDELLRSSEDLDDLSDDELDDGKPATPTCTGGDLRRPSPPSSMLSFGYCLESSPEVNPYLRSYWKDPTSSLQAERKPFSQKTIGEPQRPDESASLPGRKLLGPRPMNTRLLSVDDPIFQDAPEKQNIDLRRWSEQPAVTPPKLPPRPVSEGKHSVPATSPRPLAASRKDSYTARGGQSRPLPRKPVAHSAAHELNREVKDRSNAQDTRDTSLSLIRRYDNEQWNVGKILSKGTKTTVSGSGGSDQEISIHITTPGYSRFNDPISSVTKPPVSPTEMPSGSRDIQIPSTTAEMQLCFQRLLQVSGHGTSRNQRQRPESTDSTKGKRPSSDLPRHSRQSSDSTESHRSSTIGLPELKPGSRKAYIFRSPWEGICEFSTGMAGRSFKCKHSYTSSNPRFGPGIRSAQVSELRFNLPSSKTLGSTGSERVVIGSSRETKRSSMFLPQHRRSSSSLANNTHETGCFAPKIELEERLDLSLGQEHAGGGFGGKQAKLGKLIVENEGLQMLDLIVAANMALWWRVYERFT